MTAAAGCIDSGFARAYGKLSEALALSTFFTDTPPTAVEQRTVDAATRALALDSSIAEAHIGLALARSHAFRWADAEQEFKRALMADSTSAVAHTQYGRFLMHVGRIREALAEFRIATRLDPVSGTAFIWLGHMLSLTGKLDSSLIVQRHARQLDPGLLLGRNIGALDAAAAGRLDEARALVSGLEASAPWLGQAGYVLGVIGDTAAVRKTIRDLHSLPRNTWMVNTGLMWAYLSVGDTARALSAMEDALEARDLAPQWTSFADRPYDSVRKSARFAAVMRGYGLEVERMTADQVRTSR